jgi:hypothetical protein
LGLSDAVKRKRVVKPKTIKFDQKKEVRAIARERVGVVKASRVIVPKSKRKKPKHKKAPEEE